MIGLELGADVAANLDLDEFMVFEQNEDRSRSFFRGLLFKHITAGQADADGATVTLRNEGEFIRDGFTDRRAFDELVRAAEGVHATRSTSRLEQAFAQRPAGSPSAMSALPPAAGTRPTKRRH